MDPITAATSFSTIIGLLSNFKSERAEGNSYHFIGGSGELQIDEPRFIEDDLNTLVELGILRLDYGSMGTRKFIITRQAVQLANSG